jgi:transcriptional regulator with XRE-family HTH domain
MHIGKAAKHLRDQLGISQREAATRLGISYVHLSNIENNKVIPSAAILEAYKREWDIDLYVMAWCLNGDVDRLPAHFRGPVKQLTAAWQTQIASLLRRKDSGRASHTSS